MYGHNAQIVHSNRQNNYAISTNDLATSLTNSAAALQMSGNSLEQSVSLLTGGNTILQDPDQVSTSLKVISLRIRGVTSELSEMGEEVDDVLNTSKLQSKIKALTGVDIVDATGAFRSTYDILVDIGKVYNDLDSLSQASVLELLAGKTRSNALGAILGQIDTVEDAYKSAMSAEGSAMAENQKYMDSIQGKIDQFTNAMQTMWSNALDSDFVKLVVDVGTELIKIVDNIGLIQLSLSALFTYLITKYTKIDLSQILGGLTSKGINKIFGKDLTGGVNKATDAIDDLKKSIEEAEQAIVDNPMDEAAHKKLQQEKEKLATYEELRNKGVTPTGDKRSGFGGEIQKIKDYKKEIKELPDLIKKAEAELADAKELQVSEWNMGELGDPAKLDEYTRKVDEASQNVKKLKQRQEQLKEKGSGAFSSLADGAKKLGAQIQSVLSQMLLMAAITAVIDLISKAIDAAVETYEEAHQTFEDLSAELENTKSELKDLESQLEDTNEQIKELQLNTPLSFTDQEELSRLQGMSEELQRQIDLTETLQTAQQARVNDEAQEAAAKYKSTGVKTGKTTGENVGSAAGTGALIGGGLAIATGATAAAGSAFASSAVGAAIGSVVPGLGTVIGAAIGLAIGVAAGAAVGAAVGGAQSASEETVGESIENMEENYSKLQKEYEEARLAYQKDSSDKNKEKYEEARKALNEYSAATAEQLTQLDAYYKSVDLNTASESLKKEINDFYNTQNKWAVTQGRENAVQNAINNVLGRDEFKDTQNALDVFYKKLQETPDNTEYKEAIKVLITSNESLKENLEASGVSVDQALASYTQLAESEAFNTVEGKIDELGKATPKLKELFNNKGKSLWNGMFGEDGEVLADKISEYFDDASPQTREEIIKIIKAVNDGKMSVDAALKQFELFGVKSVLNIEIEEVKTNFKDVFPDLEAADGLIDTFKELGNAIGATADALDVFNQAEADMADKGHVSIQTALQLMEYTDDYGSVLEVVDGKLQLAKNAEDNLIEARLEAIKASARKALEEAKGAHAAAEAQVVNAQAAVSEYQNAIATETSAQVIANAWNKILAAAAGLWAGIKSLFTDESWTEAYDRAYNDTLNSIVDQTALTDEDAKRQAKLLELEATVESAKNNLTETEKEVNKLQQNDDLAQSLTKDNLKDINDPSDDKTKEEVEETKKKEALEAFQEEMDYWERRIEANQAKYEQIQNEIDLLEAKGMRAGEEYYREQIALEQERELLVDQQIAKAKEYLATQEEGSENWWTAAQKLNDLESERDDIASSILDKYDAMAAIKWDNLEEVVNRFSDLHDELSDIRDILQAEEMFDDEGNFTSAGTAVVGSYVQELEMYKNELATLQSEIADLQAHPYNEANAAYLKEVYSIDSEQEYNDLLKEWNSQQRELVMGAEDAVKSLADVYSEQVDAIEDAVNKQVEAYQDYINVVQEAYDAERELYEFKKDIQKQSKDVAETERRIAALSGSTNAADIAERRKLEAELANKKESLNDSYYNRAHDQRSQALDDEATAYEESQNRFIENLRNTLEEQFSGLVTFSENGTMTFNGFIEGVSQAVIANADTVEAEYKATGLAISDTLLEPWTKAAARIGTFGGDLAKMNEWTTDAGYFGQFKTNATNQLTAPFNSAKSALTSFQTSVKTIMGGIVSNVKSNVTNLTSDLKAVATLYDGITTSANRSKTASDAATTAANNSAKAVSAANTSNTTVAATAKLKSGATTFQATRTASSESEAKKLAKNAVIDNAYNYYKTRVNETQLERMYNGWGSKVTYLAKGSTGLKQSGFAITDESWIGEEITLAAGKNGQLQYLKKGSSVLPASISENLVEWGKLNPTDMMSRNVIQPNIANIATNNNQTIQLNIDSLVKAETITDQTLPKLEAMMDKKINKLTKDLNYALKGVGGR